MKSGADIRATKLTRVRGGSAPRVLELCAGCGGMALGLQSAGFELVAHIESDVTAAASYALNFEPPVAERAQAWSRPRDMVLSDPVSLPVELGLKGDAAEHFDVLAAGLPCQAFARIGRSKLRSVTGDEEAFRNDPRAQLYQRFLQYVEAVQPTAILIENVPDILNFGGHNVPEEICETLEELGYIARYTLLNAAYYGVPQMRERLFLIAIDSSLGLIPTFPTPTHLVKLPSGYNGMRTVALRHVPSTGSRFAPIPLTTQQLAPGVTVREALSDLPRITEHFKDPAAMRRRRVTDVVPYSRSTSLSVFANQMRTWPDMPEVTSGTDGHIVRLTPRDFEIFRRMRVGGDYPHAAVVAEEIFQERLASLRPRPSKGSKAYQDLWKACVPPYDPGKFPNKWWKLDPAMPSRTLTAHMGKDTYSHIHWDSRQKRTISVREAARLQSFPDSFRFAGSMNTAFRQIGNAVPPLLAQAVARQLKLDLQRQSMSLNEEDTSRRRTTTKAA